MVVEGRLETHPQSPFLPLTTTHLIGGVPRTPPISIPQVPLEGLGIKKLYGPLQVIGKV